MRLERSKRRNGVLTRLIFSFLAVLVASMIYMLQGVDPLDVFSALISAFTTKVGFSELLVRMIPLLLISSGLALCFRMKFWNIGAEGQYIVGAMAAFLAVESTRQPIVALLSAFAAGAVLAVPPALMKSRLGVNEVLSTLMIYYVVYWVFQYLIHGPWKAREKVGEVSYGGFAHTSIIPAELGTVPGTRISPVMLFLALSSAVLIYFVMERTKLGFEIKAFGGNPKAAEISGMSYFRTAALTMMISGGLAGLAGAGDLLAIQHRLIPEFPCGYGFTGIITAWLGGTSPLGLIAANMFFGGLLVGGEEMMIVYSLPFGAINVFNGLILMFVAAGEFLTRYRAR